MLEHADLINRETANNILRSEETEDTSYDVDEVFLNELAGGMASEYFTLDAGDTPQSVEDVWFDALEEQVPSIPDITRQLLTHLLTRAVLLTSEHLLARATGATAVWQQLRALYADTQLTAFAKAERLTSLLREHRDLVPADWHGVFDQLLEGFELVRALHRLSFGDEATMVAQVEQGIVQLQSLLVQPLVKRTLPETVQQTLNTFLAPVRQTIASLQAFAALPEGATFEDYLAVVKRVLTNPEMGGSIAPEMLIDSITRVEQLFSQVKDVLESVTTGVNDVTGLLASSPGWDASFDLKMVWLSQAVDTPSVLAVLRQQLSPETLTLLQQFLPWFRQLNSYPADSSLGQQAAWLMQQFSDPAAQSLIRQSPLQPVIEKIRQQFAGDATSLALFQALLQLTDPSQSVGQKLRQLITPLVSRQTLGQAIRGVISYGTSYGPLLDVWDWYQQQPAGLSWEATLNNFIEELQAHPERLAQLLPNALQDVVKGVDWLSQFPRGGSWQETLQWAAKSAQQFPQLQWMYNRFVELSLAKAVYGALQHAERSGQEDALRQVAQDLGQYWPGLTETGGGLLTTMIPLLPGLLGISQDIYRLPSTASWLDWINSVLGVIQGTDSPALQQLGQQLESMVANRFVEGLSVGLDSATEAASVAWNSSTTAVGSVMSNTATAVSSALNNAGVGIAGVATEAWSTMTNLKDPLRLPGAEAASIPIEPVHILEHLQQGNETQAGELFDSVTASDRERLLADPDIKSWSDKRTTLTEGDASSKTQAPTAPVTISELTALVDTGAPTLSEAEVTTAKPAEDYFIASGSVEDNRLHDLSFIDEKLLQPPSDAYLVAKVAGGVALGAWWLGTAYAAYKTYAQHRAYRQKKYELEKNKLEERERLNQEPLKDIVSSAPEEVSGLLAPVSSSDASKDLPGPAEAPRYSYAWPAALTAMTLLGGAGTYAYSRLYRDEHFDDSGLLEPDDIPELKTFWDELVDFQPDTVLSRKLRSIPLEESLSTSEPEESLSTSKPLSWKEQVKSLFDYSEYNDRVRTELTKLLDKAIAHIPERASAWYRHFLVLITLDAYYLQLVEKNKTVRGMENTSLVSSIIFEQEKLKALLLKDFPGVHTDRYYHLSNIYRRSILAYIAEHKDLHELHEVQEDAYLDAVKAHYESGETTAASDADVYRRAIASQESMFTDFMVRRSSRASIEDNKSALISLFSSSMHQIAERKRETEDPSQKLYFDVQRYHATVLLKNSLMYFEILSFLDVDALHNKYDGDRAVFEAQALAARITIQAFKVRGVADINASTDEYLDAYLQLKDMSEEIQNYLYMATVVIFEIFNGNNQLGRAVGRESSALKILLSPAQVLPWRRMRFFDEAERLAYPTANLLGERPEGFRGVADFKTSDKFTNWADYYAQFSEYSRTHINYESKIYSARVLWSVGIDDYRISRLRPEKVELLDLGGSETAPNIYLRGTNSAGIEWGSTTTFNQMLGTIGFIKMTTGEVLVVTAINGNPRSSFYEASEASSNPTLQFIFSGALSNFTSPYNIRYSLFGLGSEQIKDHVRDTKLEGNRIYASGNKHFGRSHALLSGATATGNVLDNLFREDTPPWGSGVPYLYVKSVRYDEDGIEAKSRNDITVAGNRGRLTRIIDEIMRVNLQEVSAAEKVKKEQLTLWGFFANAFIPFYDPIRKSINDADYQISADEIRDNLIMLGLTLLPFLGNARGAIQWTKNQLNIIKTAVAKALSKQLVGRQFVKAVITDLAADTTLATFPWLRRVRYLSEVAQAPLPLKIRLRLLSRIRKETAMTPGPRVARPNAAGSAANRVSFGAKGTINLREARTPRAGWSNPSSLSNRALAGELLEAETPIIHEAPSETPVIPREPKRQLVDLCPSPTRGKRNPGRLGCVYSTEEQAVIDEAQLARSSSDDPVKAAEEVHAQLRTRAFTNVHYGVLGVWEENANLMQRYVVFGTKDGVEVAVGIHSEDFYINGGINTKENWLATFADGCKQDKTKLVKYKEIRSDRIPPVFSAPEVSGPFTPLRETYTLVEPFWYRVAFPQQAPLIEHAVGSSLSRSDQAVNVARNAIKEGYLSHVKDACSFPIKVQKKVGILTKADAKRERNLIERGALSADLGESPLVITSQAQMMGVPKAARIEFIDPVSNRIEHGMISTGSGNAIGIKNDWLDIRYGAEAREINLAEDIVWKNDGAYLPEGNKKIIIKAQSSVPNTQVRPERYEAHTSRYQKDYAINISGVDALRSKIKLKLSKGDTRVQVFDERTNAYIKSENYAVIPYHCTIMDDVFLDNEVAQAAARDFHSKYVELENIAKNYTGTGAADLQANLAVGKTLVSELAGDASELSTNIVRFALVENPARSVTADNILGFAKIVDLPAGSRLGETGQIVIESVVAHPYTIISKNDEFMSYAANKLGMPAPEILKRYKLKRIGGQLARDGVKKVLQKIDKEIVELGRSDRPTEIITSARNPITAKMAERFGGKIVSDSSEILGMEDPTFVHEGPVKVPEQVVTRDSPGLIVEALNTELTPLTELSDNQKYVVQYVQGLLENDETLARYIASPSENCDRAASRVSEILSTKGFSNIHFGELGIWRSEFGGPTNHFVVFARKSALDEVVDIAVDITAGQFRKPGMQGPIYTTPNNWVSTIKNAYGGTGRHQNLVKYKVFDEPFVRDRHSGMRDVFHQQLNPFVNLPGAEILARPPWHARVFESLARRTEASRRFDTVIDRTLSTPNGATSAESSWNFVLERQQDAGILSNTDAKKLLGKKWNRNNYNKYLNNTASTVSDIEALSKVPKGNRMVLEVVSSGSSHPMLSLGGGYALAVDNTWMGKGYGAGVQKISLISDFEGGPIPGTFKLKGARGEVTIKAESGSKFPTVETSEPTPPETVEERSNRCREALFSDCAPSSGVFGENPKFAKGDISPLKDQGPFTLEGSPDDVPFDYQVYRYDDIGGGVHMREPENIATGGAQCDAFLLRGTGEGLLSPTGKQLLGENVRVINVVNGDAGTVAVKIPLNRITEANPLLAWSGDLSGCTVVYAVKDDHFFIYHAGFRSNAEGLPRNWTTGVEGVNSIAKSHTAFTGAELSDLQLNNNSLVDIFSTYDSAVIAYMGKEGRIITRTSPNVHTFNYAEIPYEPRTARVGSSQVLLTRIGGKVKLECLSEDIFNPVTPGKSMVETNKDFRVLKSKTTSMGLFDVPPDS